MVNEVLWEPSEDRKAATNLHRFLRAAEGRWGVALPNYDAAHRWSVDRLEEFWQTLWDELGLIGDRGERILSDRDKMPGACFFPDGSVNFAENMLRHTGSEPAIIFRREDGLRRSLTRDELRGLVARIATALVEAGVERGDRVAGYLPNIPEAMACKLAAASIGAVWSSCSPDFGVRGVTDRFGQIEPRILFSVDGYKYAGKSLDQTAKLKEVMAGLPTVEALVVIPFLHDEPDLSGLPKAIAFDAFLGPAAVAEPSFAPLPFDHPLCILFSSGTTGMPKCIVHSHGGALLTGMKEHALHVDERPGDRLFYFTTLGWMMWNWLLGGLGTGATLLLYDGSPFHPGPEVLWDFAQDEGMTVFGTSAKYIDSIRKAGLEPAKTHDLSKLRTILSTGSPLVPESFDYIYEQVKSDVHLASMSGGTDLYGCFVGGNPLAPVRRGEIQGPMLGMAVDVWDDDGKPIREQKGELVCTEPFPSMPVMFWNDPDGERYRSAYFDRFPGSWCHGDWAEWTQAGGMMIYGRSDATLNPGGVRIGTAEIYRQVEQLEEVVESIVIGQEWDGDTRVVLFVRLRDGLSLDDGLRDRIKRQIRENASPRHVPARVIQVADIPRTKSGKITELAVRDIVHGRPVKNVEALDNPAALDLYKALPELTA